MIKISGTNKTACLLLLFASFLTSCSKEDVKPEPRFNILNNTSLTFEYYFDFEDIGQMPVNKIDMDIKEYKFKGKDYFAFSYSGGTKPAFTYSHNDDILEYNFLPIRYEDGNYYELRGNHELIILKDNIKVGDSWSSDFHLENDEVITTFSFKVLEKYAVYEEFGIKYNDVFVLQETLSGSNTSNELVSLHYYNYKNGIIRREIPMYVSGTYGPITFNRIK